MLRIGVIGCGEITRRRHAPEYAANQDVELSAWFDLDERRARDMAERYGGTVYGSWQALLRDAHCDAVSVCTSNETHAQITIAALQNGCHVLCEKPMATSVVECREMVETARICGKQLFIGQNQRLSPAHVAARDMLRAGRIGRVLSLSTSFGHAGPEKWANTLHPWFFDQKRAAFGAMFDLGIHKLDLIRYLLDDEIVSGAALTATLDKRDSIGRPIQVEDNAVAVLRMKGGALAQLTASWTYYAKENNATRIVGTEGMLSSYEDGRTPLVYTDNNGVETCYPLGGIQTNANQFNSGIIDLFIADLLAGREASISGHDVFLSMEAAFALLASAGQKRYMQINNQNEGEA